MFAWHKLAVIGALSTLSFACSDDGGDEGPSSTLADVIFVNDINDEALERMLEKTPTDDPSQRLQIDDPSPDAVLDGTQPATFSWKPAQTAALTPSAEPGGRSPWQRFASSLERFLSPVGVAHAHGPTYNGTAYFLVFSTPSNPKLLRVFTAAKSYTPDATGWQTLAEAASPITLDVTSATFENSLLTSDGGPFLGGSVTFTIE